MKIKIFQINSDRDKNNVKFCSLEETRKAQRKAAINPKIYDEVYSGEVDCKTLEDVFTLFNTDFPPRHLGHSLSVSDIIQITENTDNYLRGCFFVDRIGFESINFDTALAQRPQDLIRTVMLEPGKPAYEAEIPNTLHGMQRAVKGYIEAAYPFSDNAVLIANEEGLLLDMAPNRFINLQTYVGPVFIVGDNGDGEFCSLTDEQMERYLAEFSEPEMSLQDEDMDFGMNML